MRNFISNQTATVSCIMLVTLSGCLLDRKRETETSDATIFSVLGESNESVETSKAYAEMEKRGGNTTELRQQAAAVGKIEIPGGGSATGFLVAPDLIMTNSHVVNNDKAADPSGSIRRYDANVVNGMTFDNGYERNGRGNPIRVKEVVMANADHDVALIRLEKPITNVKPLKLETKTVADAPAYVIGHPKGEYKQFSYYQKTRNPDGTITTSDTKVAPISTIQQNKEYSPDPYYDRKYKNAVIHNADTLGGSSGSPLISNGRVIGLHFAGFRSGEGPYSETPHNAAITTSSIANLMKQNRDQLPADVWSIFAEQSE